MIIYADVLIVINLYINYFLIRAAALILRRSTSRRRSAIAASIGAASSLVILAQELPLAATVGIKIAVCAAMTLAAFGNFALPARAAQKRKASFLRELFGKDFVAAALCVLAVSCVFAGAFMALWYFFAPFGMLYENGIAYFNVSLPILAVFTIIAYALVRAVRFFDRKRQTSRGRFEVEISLGGKAVQLAGFADTGNSLRDPFSGLAVIVCKRSAIEQLLPESVLGYLDGKSCGAIKLIPCKTLAGEKPLPAFRAERILISGKPVEAIVGVCGELGGADCIFDPEIISI